MDGGSVLVTEAFGSLSMRLAACPDFLRCHRGVLVNRHYDEVETMYRKIRGWRHDWRGHMQVLAAYLELNQIDEARTYLYALQTDLNTVDTVLKTGNKTVDAILNSKLTLIRERGIAVDATAQVPEEIGINGIDIRKYDYQEYCDLFGVVFQDFVIPEFRLGEVLSCASTWEKDRAMDALGRVGLRSRVEELNGEDQTRGANPDGAALPTGMEAADPLTVYVGKGFDENGVNFSGGEKQKLAIARAIYKNAPFVIMDEPTAVLDPEAETEVFAGFDKMVGRKTALYISHRLASCRFCEDILVFDDGQIVQRGSHEELVAQSGLYRKLWEAQSVYHSEGYEQRA